jgi:hypothetical protein
MLGACEMVGDSELTRRVGDFLFIRVRKAQEHRLRK